MLLSKLQIRSSPSRNIVLHGLEATGKSSITKALLQKLSSKPTNGVTNGNDGHHSDSLLYAVVKSAECIGGRHLLEQTIGAVAQALGSTGNIARCENLAQLAVVIGALMEVWTSLNGHRRLVLVFDGIDRQRDAPPTLLQALARLGETVSQQRLSEVWVANITRSRTSQPFL